jgi:hypothetical protein
MTRSAAFRAGTLFVFLTALFAAIGLSSHAPVAEALFLITGSVCTVMLLFAFARPADASVPVRIRRDRFVI